MRIYKMTKTYTWNIFLIIPEGNKEKRKKRRRVNLDYRVEAFKRLLVPRDETKIRLVTDNEEYGIESHPIQGWCHSTHQPTHCTVYIIFHGFFFFLSSNKGNIIDICNTCNCASPGPENIFTVLWKTGAMRTGQTRWVCAWRRWGQAWKQSAVQTGGCFLIVGGGVFCCSLQRPLKPKHQPPKLESCY